MATRSMVEQADPTSYARNREPGSVVDHGSQGWPHLSSSTGACLCPCSRCLGPGGCKCRLCSGKGHAGCLRATVVI